MIVYFDTSALIPLLIEEPGSATAARLWDEADHVVSVRLIYAEARAALALAQRMGRMTWHALQSQIEEIDSLYSQLDLLEVDDDLVRRAGDVAQNFELRGYDAVHLAAAERLAHPDVVMATGDRELIHAARELGIGTAATA